MPLSLGGIGLTPLHSHFEMAAHFWHESRISEWEFQNYFTPGTAAFPTPYFPQRECPAVGRLHWPVGADEWATCHLVATGEQVILLREAIGLDPVPLTLRITDGTAAGTIETEMYSIIRPICQKGSNEWFLVTCMDERYYWHMCGSSEIPQMPASWEDFLQELFGLIGVTPVIESIPSGYSTPNTQRWTTGIQPIPIVIQSVVRQIGMQVVRSLDGTVSVVRPATAYADDAARWTRIETKVLNGGRIDPTDIGRIVPGDVDVCFFDGDNGTFNTESRTLSALAITEYGGTQGVSAGRARISADPLSAEASERTAWADQAAEDYYRWCLSRTDVTLRGIVNENPVGMDGMMEWVHHPDMLVTRIIRPEWADRNIYGELGPNFPNPNWIPQSGSGSGSGSGNQPGCSKAIEPVEFDCDDGVRTATVKSIAVGIEDGQLALVECNSDESVLGPCSPVNPEGAKTPFVSRVCPVVGRIDVIATDYNVNFETDDILHGDTTLGPLTFFLPPPTTLVHSSGPGADQFIIKNIGTSDLTVDPGALTLDGGGAIVLNQWDCITVYNDGTNWFVMSRN